MPFVGKLNLKERETDFSCNIEKSEIGWRNTLIVSFFNTNIDGNIDYQDAITDMRTK